ncbi:hypothetical protein D046_8015B, partial [Vibrio parahaemolyticus V-223/04]
SQLKRD